MHRILIMLLLMCAPLVWAQEADDNDTAQPDAAESAEEAETDSDDALEDIDGLDEPYPLEDDDVFIPSEDVGFGQSIPFPTDI